MQKCHVTRKIYRLFYIYSCKRSSQVPQPTCFWKLVFKSGGDPVYKRSCQLQCHHHHSPCYLIFSPAPPPLQKRLRLLLHVPSVLSPLGEEDLFPEYYRQEVASLAPPPRRRETAAGDTKQNQLLFTPNLNSEHGPKPYRH